MTEPRGRALVINNSKFDQALCKLRPRQGSEKDLSKMKNMLEEFTFEVTVKENLTSRVSI